MKANRFTRRLCLAAVIAALYAAITVVTAPLSYGLVQLRLSEALIVLCPLAPSLGVGLTLGCFLANLFSTVTALDALVGTLATALSCLWTMRCKREWFIPLPNALVNAVLVGGLLAWVLFPEQPGVGFLLCAAQVGFGELAVMYGLGLPLLRFARRTGLMEKLLGKL